MLTLVVPESGSVAAALRAMVDAGRNFNDAGCAGSLREVCWGLVVDVRLKELGHGRKRLTNSGDGLLIRQPAASGLIFLRPAPNPTLCRP